MKIGVISDTHITEKTKDLPQKILEEFKKVDMVIHAGDLVDPSVLEKLKAVCKNVRAVRGNMDPPEIKNKLPEKEIIKAGDLKIGVMHGYGPPNNLVPVLTAAFINDSVDVVIFGHSHIPMNEKKGGILFFNPGSAMDKVFAPYNSFGVIEVNGEKIEARIIKL